jgi:hypothetical protein
MAATKLRPSSLSLHGVFHKSRVFDLTCLYEAKAKPMMHPKCLFGSNITNYDGDERLHHTPRIIKLMRGRYTKNGLTILLSNSIVNPKLFDKSKMIFPFMRYKDNTFL